MTLNGVMAVILRYFSEFAYLPAVLRESSRSLSHLLMSSCLFMVQHNTLICELCWKQTFPTRYGTIRYINGCPKIDG